MTSILRATAILSSSSMVSIAVGLISAKAWAVLLGPSGLGFMGLLQGLVGFASLIAGMSIGTGLVRLGANAVAGEDHAKIATLYRSAWLLLWVLGCLAVLVLVTFRTTLSTWVLGTPNHADSVALVGLAVLFNQAAALQTGILNTFHRVSALARLSIFSSLLGTGLSLTLIWLWGEHGIVPAIIAGTAAGWAVSHYYVRREVAVAPARLTRHHLLATARALLQFGAPYTASMLVGTAVQLALPVMVLHILGRTSVGFYQAAVAISVHYLSFLLVAMGQDYYPRLAAASDQPAALRKLVNQQHRLVLLLATPLLLALLGLAPYLVTLVYSPDFAPTTAILEWYLIGDLVKFSSWTIGFVVLVRCRGITLFLTELMVGLDLLIMSWLSMQWGGLAGLGLAFLATYAIHHLVVWLIIRPKIALTLGRQNQFLFIASLMAMLAIVLLPTLGLNHFRTPVALVLTLLSGISSLYLLWREYAPQHAERVLQLVQSWRHST